MGDKNDELGLSLGLGLGYGAKPSSSSSSSFHLNLMQNPETNHQRVFGIFGFTDRNATSFRRGIDVNQAAVGDFEDENGVSSPNSTVSSLSGKRSERGEDNEAERTSCSLGGSDDEDGIGGGDTSKKKLRLTKEQSLLLEDMFKEHHTLNTVSVNSRQKQELAQKLNLSARQVEVWFQNRRARTKLKQTEVDCDQLRKCCENLTEENRRLQKEVQELRALKLSPQFYMQMNPPTTLTMCPSCQCVGVSSSSSSSASATTASSTVPATSPTGHPVQPTIHRPVPISPWATLPIPQHRPVDAPAPAPRS
ncbi:homeobox-leucine zipper protein HAT3 isoform X1 [Rosa chinensis]|uniref:homeobox-leucine zipper protein HAT3 isoform X1 n=1 Tax=Rosa chinensis TaxID=74649 RepID=UPI000D08B4D2|nr:homeobox-leucine zipper protein HAT3 isoform X1 [Rosa chinensis]